MLDSLVRVSRRVADNHYANIRAEARSSVPGGRMTPWAISLPRRVDTFPGPLTDPQNRCWPGHDGVAQPKGKGEPPRASLVASASLSTISHTV